MHIGMGASAVSENGDSAEHEGWLTIAGERGVVDQNSASWNQIVLWLRELDHLLLAA